MSRIALVTGGTSGIGAAISKKLQANGYKVVVVYHKGQERAEQFHQETKIPIYDWDVGSFKECEEGIKRIKKEIGTPEILVNDAGITRDGMMHKMSEEDWSSVIQVNLGSMFNMTRQLINDMRENNFGRIVNISSINAQKGQLGQTNYCAAKAGILGFTRALALESAHHNVTVNAIAPGYINTPMVEKIPKDVLDDIIKTVPVGRLGKPEEIARTVAFLVADEADYITGATFSINGGQYLAS